jgi:hypothetical protein
VKYLVEIYEIEKITNPKSKLSVIEKINHLLKLQEALLNKLTLMKSGKVTQTNKDQLRFAVTGGLLQQEQLRDTAGSKQALQPLGGVADAGNNSDIEEVDMEMVNDENKEVGGATSTISPTSIITTAN